MAAIVTAPPILIDPVGFSRQSAAEINQMGPWQQGTDLYILLSPQTGAAGKGIFRSTDSGLTWTRQDVAGEPDSAGRLIWAYYNDSTGIIGFVTSGPSFTWLAIYFDTNTNLYTTTATAALFAPAPNASGAFFYHQSGGVDPWVYVEGTNLKYLTVSGGVWSGPPPTTLYNFGSARYIHAGVGDASDRGHFCYVDNSNVFYYNQLTAALALGTEVTLGMADNYRADMRIFGTNVVVAYTDLQTVHVQIGTPLSGPTFTDHLIRTTTGANQVSYATLAVNKTGNLVVFWVELDLSGSPIDQLWMSTFNGTSWGAPVLFYDEVLNPPADSASSQFIHTGEAIQLADGTWVFATALETNPAGVGGGPFCTGFILRGSPVAILPTSADMLQYIKRHQAPGN